MSLNVDISVPHLIPLNPSGSEGDLEGPSGSKTTYQKDAEYNSQNLSFLHCSHF